MRGKITQRHAFVNNNFSIPLVIGGVNCHWQLLPEDTLQSARTWLRDIAGDAAAESLQRDDRGRPRLGAGMGDISWSHSGGRMLLAHAPSAMIGVDVERLARRVDALRIARRYFTAAEIALLESLALDGRHNAFLQLWCAKEAILKAHGHGIAFGLSKVVFHIADGQLHMTRCDPGLGEVRDWRLHAFEPEPGFVAVLARCNPILRA